MCIVCVLCVCFCVWACVYAYVCKFVFICVHVYMLVHMDMYVIPFQDYYSKLSNENRAIHKNVQSPIFLINVYFFNSI